ncbi:DUF3426 domain-containing protein [Paenalcaligenes niemegkensis]|uniref:zinc-ribbon and DUF3426 domain-containing protein n=1 Tax=Paenalcaligenes niemegkensis TaxID=2895469 RepID=UPI001EE973D2|nr:zinc-ribbon and DUF3426 domain-containing protein [Paenalcaligenes niemegkensis]MCQ9615457.1 DUF3426 domain-containing protein [Paenalcaligenes niemegkensis]
MELTTQCPRCKSRFSASVADLQRRKGFIRCVNCAHIFDGFEEVVPDDEQIPTEQIPTEPLPPVLPSPVSGSAEPVWRQPLQSESAELSEPFVPDSVWSTQADPSSTGPAHVLHDATLRDLKITDAEPDTAAPYIGSDDDLSASTEADEPRFYADVPGVVRAAEPLIAIRSQPDTAPQVIRSDRRHFIAPSDDVEPALNLTAHDNTPVVEHPPIAAAPPPPAEHELRSHGYSAALEDLTADEPKLSVAQDEPLLSDDGFYVSNRADDDEFAHDAIPAHPGTIYVDPVLKPDLGDNRADAPEYSFSQRAGRLFWIMVLALLAGVLILQLLYVFRNQVANQLPVTRPALESLCNQLGCEVAYERRINYIHIVSSSLQLQAGSGSAQDLYNLRIRLRNDYKRKQEWPTLIVTFSDISTAVISRLEIPPQRYLRPEQLQNAFGAFDEIEFTLPIDSRGKRINGYKIDKYFS